MSTKEYMDMKTSTDENVKKCWRNFKQCHELANIELLFLDKSLFPLREGEEPQDTHFFWESKGKSGWQLTGTIDTDLDRAHDVFITADNASLIHRCSDELKLIFANSTKITPEHVNKSNEMPTQFKRAIGLIS